MPTTLHKTRKQIAKKRNGVVNALHEKSRDSMRLHKAGLTVLLSFNKLYALRTEITKVPQKLMSFVHQYDEEYNEAKKARRPGRPASVKEDLLKAKINILEEEYKSGFVMPDLLDNVNVNALHLWEGSWSYLTQLKWVKVNSEGQIRPTSFPSGGTN
ncbi:TMA16-like protein [Fusarium pseudoanthophilum]|uniref:TMA16-like protein n=1 Tax=Fusarium pseudoanthophilum TaxID=48495 RepID=A0A8H5NNV7_9HYPO|nr:TMA16-like protein [Fusarium pseudoanthophilum]